MSLRSPTFSFAVRGSKIYAAGAKSRGKRERERGEKEAFCCSRLDEVPRLKYRM